MKPRCNAPLPNGTLLDYWAHELADGDKTDHVEEHLFTCGDCAARLQDMVSLGTGLTALVRRGRVTGIVSRSLLNRMQRDGVQVRLYSLLPGETVPCACFPGDDLVVASLRADFSGVDAVTLAVTGPGASPMSAFDDAPVSGPGGEVLFALPGAVARQLPSMRLVLTLVSSGPTRAELGRYVLDHSALQPPM
jgi:hypothetical protein